MVEKNDDGIINTNQEMRQESQKDASRSFRNVTNILAKKGYVGCGKRVPPTRKSVDGVLGKPLRANYPMLVLRQCGLEPTLRKLTLLTNGCLHSNKLLKSSIIFNFQIFVCGTCLTKVSEIFA